MIDKSYKLCCVKIGFSKVLNYNEIKEVILHYTTFFNLKVVDVLKGQFRTTIIFRPKED